MMQNISSFLTRRLNLFIPSVLLVFSIFLQPAFDPDLGWQLRCGEEILEGKGFCTSNTFSAVSTDYKWVNHHWLYQALLYITYTLFGLYGTFILQAVVLSLTFTFFYLAFKSLGAFRTPIFLIFCFLCSNIFSLGIRSQELGVLFFCILLYLLGYIKNSRISSGKLSFLIPLVMLIWANTHGSFVLGIVILLFLSPFLVIPSFAVTLINPSTYNLYTEVWRHFNGIDLSKLIAEWLPPNEGIVILISILTVWTVIYKLTVESKRDIQHVLETLMILPFAYLAVRVQRHVPYFLLSLVYVYQGRDLKNIIPEKTENILKPVVFILYTLGFIFVFLANVGYGLKVSSSMSTYCSESFLDLPCEAIDILKSEGSKGVLFNRYEWGGFLIWQLPSYKVFVDGRMPAWDMGEGKSPYSFYLETLQTKPEWEDTLKAYNVTKILISPNTFMDLTLKDNPQKYGFSEQKRTNSYVLYERL